MKGINLLWLLLVSTTVLGQKTGGQVEITGVVLDSASHKPMRTASVSLLAARDSAYITATITDGDGRFRLRNVPPGNYRLLVTFIGYRNTSKSIQVHSEKPADAGTLWMSEQGNLLSEVVVTQERAPVTIKADTLEFNAGSFKTQPNAQVEELLRKLPGVEVARDGSIRANGQTVGKVLVDGKPFFGNDPKMATRNLPADIIDKVQLYDQSSDQSQFSGMDDGNRERTINLTIRKDKGKGYFGQNALGAGPNPGALATRYQARLNVNRFNNRNGGPVRQISVVGQANNLNQQNFTMQDATTPGAGGPVIVGEAGGNMQDNAQTPSAITEVRAGGLNYRNESTTMRWGKRTEMAASYFVGQSITTTDQGSHRENILPGQSFLTDQHYFSKNSMTTHRLNGRFDLPLDSMTSVRVTPNISLQYKNEQVRWKSGSYRPTGDSLNNGATSNDRDGHSVNGYNNLLLMRKFAKEGRTFSAQLNTVLADGKTTAYNRSFNTYYDTARDDSLLDQRNLQNSYSLQNNLTLSFTEPLSLTQKLEFRYAYGNTLNKLARITADRDEQTGAYDLPNQDLSNDFSNTFETNRLGSSFQTRRLRYSWALGMDIQRSALRSENRSEAAFSGRAFWYWMPNALFTYTFQGNRNLRMQYRTRISPPGITQLQPVADNSNPMNIRTGNAALKPEYYHTLTLTYQGGAQSGNSNLFAFANVNQSNNRISTSTSTGPDGVQLIQPINVNGYFSANGMISLSRKLVPVKLTIGLATQASLTRSTSIINAQRNISQNNIFGQGIRLQSEYNGKIDYGLSARVSYQQARYTLLPQQNANYWSQYATADVHWQLPGHVVLNTDLTYTGTAGRAAGYNQQFVLWNAFVAKQFLKTRQAEIRLQVFDLLNQNRSLVRNTSDSYIEDVRSKVLRRYFLVSVVYHLRKFGI
nr:outer membrane beta-barrel protein [uncultured Dyadobacter sp.]